MSQFSHCPAAVPDHLLRVALSLCHPHPDKIAWTLLKCGEMGESLRRVLMLHKDFTHLKII